MYLLLNLYRYCTYTLDVPQHLCDSILYVIVYYIKDIDYVQKMMIISIFEKFFWYVYKYTPSIKQI